MAQELGAKFVPVDFDRQVFPVSGTAIRENPLAHFDFLPAAIRPYFSKRVCVFGPESTGKSTLAKALAEHFRSVCVPEYARTFLEAKQALARAARPTADADIELDANDFLTIARGQIASEEALARQSSGVLVVDTDPLLTTIWSEALLGSISPGLHQLAKRRYDLYLLLDVDVPWVEDHVRYFPDNRTDFFARCEQALVESSCPYVKIDGPFSERLTRAIAACEAHHCIRSVV